MGLATAESLSASGWKVSILDMNQKAGEEVVARLGGLFTRVNVTVYDELAAGFGLTWKKYGRIDFGKNLPTSRSLNRFFERTSIAYCFIRSSIRKCWYCCQIRLL